MKRSKFIMQVSTAMVVGIPIMALTTSCDNNTDAPAPTPPTNDADCLANGTNSSIGGNHGHSLTVSKSDVNSGVEKTYSIMGTAGHNHDVTVTAADFTKLKGNTSISVTSTSGSGHTHGVTVSCA